MFISNENALSVTAQHGNGSPDSHKGLDAQSEYIKSGYTDLVTSGRSSCGEPACSVLHVIANSKAAPYFGKPNFGYNFTFADSNGTITVSGSGTCVPPSSPGVVVCQPTDSQTVHSTFNVQAFARVTGGVYRFELWAGSTKVLTVRDSGTMNSNVTLSPGTYTLQFVARNAAGTDRQVKSVHVTVTQ